MQLFLVSRADGRKKVKRVKSVFILYLFYSLSYIFSLPLMKTFTGEIL